MMLSPIVSVIVVVVSIGQDSWLKGCFASLVGYIRSTSSG